MPHLSDRQKHANALLEAFILQTIIDAQESTDAPDTDRTGSNWETDSEKEDNHSSTSSDWGMGIEEDESPVSDMVIEACHWLYENFYIEEHHFFLDLRFAFLCLVLPTLLHWFGIFFPKRWGCLGFGGSGCLCAFCITFGFDNN